MELDSVDTNQLIVTQANSLVYAAYEMSLQEKRLLLLLFSMVRQNHTAFHTYRIPVKQIGELLEIDQSNTYRVLDKTCTKLMSRVLHMETDTKRWVKFHWVARAEYIPKKESRTGEAELELKIHDELHPLLLELKKQFASVPFEHIANLPSYHSIRLFEILFHKSQKLKKSKIRIRLNDLKKYLGVENNYPNFSNFKNKILEPAKKNLAKKTPIKFTYLPIKEGRKVAALDFIVTENSGAQSGQMELNLNTPRTLRFLQIENNQTEEPVTKKKIPSHHKTLVNKLGEMGYMGDGLALIERIGEQAVKDLLNLAKRQEEAGKGTGKEIKNMGGLINWLVQEEAWKVEAAQREAKEKAQKQAEEYQKKIERSKKVSELIESVTAEYNEAYRNHTDEYWQFTLTPEEQELIKEDMRVNGNDFALKFLNKNGWNNENLFFASERDKALERLDLEPELPPYLRSKEDYLKHQPQYKNIDPEIIEEVVLFWKNKGL